MGMRTIRLGSTLTFNEEQEKDIIDLIERLNSSHKTGQFISNLLRVAVDCPEVLAKVNGQYEMGPAMQQLDTLGMSVSRRQYMISLGKEIAAMKNKVDAVYEQSMKVYMLAQAGKHLALEQRADNNLRASFICQKQLNELQSSLGMMLIDNVYASDKLDKAHKTADDAFEYILNAYGDIVEELRRSLSIEPLRIEAEPLKIEVEKLRVEAEKLKIDVDPLTIPVNPVNIPVVSTGVVGNPVVMSQTAPIINAGSNDQSDESEDGIIDFGDVEEPVSEEEPIDFGADADMEALGNFFGM